MTPQERNRVAINFTIEEGEVAKIARINIIGAKAFTEKELLGEMQLTTPGWTDLVHQERPVLASRS